MFLPLTIVLTADLQGSFGPAEPRDAAPGRRPVPSSIGVGPPSRTRARAPRLLRPALMPRGPRQGTRPPPPRLPSAGQRRPRASPGRDDVVDEDDPAVRDGAPPRRVGAERRGNVRARRSLPARTGESWPRSRRSAGRNAFQRHGGGARDQLGLVVAGGRPVGCRGPGRARGGRRRCRLPPAGPPRPPERRRQRPLAAYFRAWRRSGRRRRTARTTPAGRGQGNVEASRSARRGGTRRRVELRAACDAERLALAPAAHARGREGEVEDAPGDAAGVPRDGHRRRMTPAACPALISHLPGACLVLTSH